MRAVLSRHGLTMDDIEMVNVNWSLAPSVMSGQVDAVIGAYRNVELHQMAIEGVKGRCFFIEEEGMPSYDELIYVANPELMDKAKIVRFLAATERATQYIVNHPEESFEIYAGTAPELNDELNKRSWADTIRRFALRPAALDHGRYARFEEFLKENGPDRDDPPGLRPRHRRERPMSGAERILEAPYGSPVYGAWRQEAAGDWQAYTHHAFVRTARRRHAAAGDFPALPDAGLHLPVPLRPRLGAGGGEVRDDCGGALCRLHRRRADEHRDEPACRHLRQGRHLGGGPACRRRGAGEPRLYALRAGCRHVG